MSSTIEHYVLTDDSGQPPITRTREGIHKFIESILDNLQDQGLGAEESIRIQYSPEPYTAAKKLPKEKWWCAHHNREATHVTENGDHVCDPSLGGILLPCVSVLVERGFKPDPYGSSTNPIHT